MTIKSACVYCSSSNNIDKKYKELARDVGSFLAQKEITLIYGGGHVGMMGEAADSCLQAGGKVTGVIPAHLHDREVQHTGLTELFVVNTMHERKMMMAERAEGFIILPGGLGTLDEAFEILTWKQLGLHHKPVALFNLDEFWNPMIQLIREIVDEQFAPKSNLHIFEEVRTIKELEAALNAPADEIFDPSDKWKS